MKNPNEASEMAAVPVAWEGITALPAQARHVLGSSWPQEDI